MTTVSNKVNNLENRNINIKCEQIVEEFPQLNMKCSVILNLLSTVEKKQEEIYVSSENLKENNKVTVEETSDMPNENVNSKKRVFVMDDDISEDKVRMEREHIPDGLNDKDLHLQKTVTCILAELTHAVSGLLSTELALFQIRTICEHKVDVNNVGNIDRDEIIEERHHSMGLAKTNYDNKLCETIGLYLAKEYVNQYTSSSNTKWLATQQIHSYKVARKQMKSMYECRLKCYRAAYPFFGKFKLTSRYRCRKCEFKDPSHTVRESHYHETHVLDKNTNTAENRLSKLLQKKSNMNYMPSYTSNPIKKLSSYSLATSNQSPHIGLVKSTQSRYQWNWKDGTVPSSKSQPGPVSCTICCVCRRIETVDKVEDHAMKCANGALQNDIDVNSAIALCFPALFKKMCQLCHNVLVSIDKASQHALRCVLVMGKDMSGDLSRAMRYCFPGLGNSPVVSSSVTPSLQTIAPKPMNFAPAQVQQKGLKNERMFEASDKDDIKIVREVMVTTPGGKTVKPITYDATTPSSPSFDSLDMVLEDMSTIGVSAEKLLSIGSKLHILQDVMMKVDENIIILISTLHIQVPRMNDCLIHHTIPLIEVVKKDNMQRVFEFIKKSSETLPPKHVIHCLLLNKVHLLYSDKVQKAFSDIRIHNYSQTFGNSSSADTSHGRVTTVPYSQLLP